MRKSLLSLVFLGAVVASQAAVIINFNATNTSGIPDGQIATLKIENDGANTVKFTATANWNSAVYGADAFISTIGLNASPTPNTVTDAAGGSLASYGGSGNSGGISTNYMVDFPTSNMGGGALRFKNGEVATWKTSKVGLSESSFGDIEKLHLQGMDKFGGTTSAWFYAEPVPEPASMIALAAGALGVIRRRNKKA
jgi:hypothetical protein